MKIRWFHDDLRKSTEMFLQYFSGNCAEMLRRVDMWSASRTQACSCRSVKENACLKGTSRSLCSIGGTEFNVIL